MAENLLRFTRCLDSPFTTEPLLSLLGLLANTDTAEEVLRGTLIPPPGLDPYAKDILEEMQRPPPDRCIQKKELKITAKMMQGWRKRRANTACEASGLTFSHHIVGSYNPIVSEVDAAIHSAPFEKGFAPPRLAVHHRHRDPQETRGLGRGQDENYPTDEFLFQHE